MRINAAFSLLPSEAISVLSATQPHPNTGLEVLIIAKALPYTIKPKPDTALLVDNAFTGSSYDMLWQASDFKSALSSYQQLKASGRLIMDNKIAEYDLDNAIEMVRQRDNGANEYNINNLMNGHIAILATCLFFQNQDGFLKAQSASDFWQNMMMTI